MPSTSPVATLSGDCVLSVQGLGKRFCRNLRRSMWYGMQDLARNLVGNRPGLRGGPDGLRRDEFWALRDVSFELGRGEVLGIVGTNGSGKSTLLRLITGIFPPDEGQVSLRGRVGALISLGAGFHPHMTGRENIFLNGAILGMSRKQVAERFDQIVDFAELRDFLDAPVATYSSGMYMRLGFSIAISLEPELLVVDEVLSVGDAAFRNKSFERMQALIKSGTTVLFVSHMPQAVEMLSTKALWMDHGRVRMLGPADRVLASYAMAVEGATPGAVESAPVVLDHDLHPLAITTFETADEHGRVRRQFGWRETIVFRLHYRSLRAVPRPYFDIRIRRPGADSKTLMRCFMCDSGVQWDVAPGEGIVECVLPAPPLCAGPYEVVCAILRTPTVAVSQGHYQEPFCAGTFDIHATPAEMGLPGMLNALAPTSQPVLWDHAWVRVAPRTGTRDEHHVVVPGPAGGRGKV